MRGSEDRWNMSGGLRIIAAVITSASSTLAATASDGAPSFNRDIRPILSRCIACHGPDAAARAANLRLDDRDDAIRDRRRGATIVPGDPDASTLLQRVTSHDPDDVMPPPGAGEPISTEELKTLRAWIAAGATYETHWAWVAPRSHLHHAGRRRRLGPSRPRSIRRPTARGARTDAVPRGRSHHPRPTRGPRSHRTAADDRGTRHPSRRSRSGRLRAVRRSTARVARVR